METDNFRYFIAVIYSVSTVLFLVHLRYSDFILYQNIINFAYNQNKHKARTNLLIGHIGAIYYE